MRIVVIDTETTGLSPKGGSQMVDIGSDVIDNWALHGALNHAKLTAQVFLKLSQCQSDPKLAQHHHSIVSPNHHNAQDFKHHPAP